MKRVRASAPGRVNLIGEHIDYNDGWVLPFAISERTSATIEVTERAALSISSLQQQDRIEIPLDEITPEKRRSDWSDYVVGTFWALEISDRLNGHGLSIEIDGQVPLGAGLSSSAALECAVALALDGLFQLSRSREELARITQRAENLYVGMPCGIMDQSVSLMAKKGHALLLDCLSLATEQIPFDLAGAGLELLVIDTNAHHALVDGGYKERRDTCATALRQLGFKSMRDLDEAQLELFGNSLDEISYKRVRHAVTEIARVHQSVAALKSRDFALVGQLLNASHQSLRDDYQVSCPELDLAVQVSHDQGALGARMVGGGFGGSAIALTPKDLAPKMTEAVARAFSTAGFTSPRFFDAVTDDGARIESIS